MLFFILLLLLPTLVRGDDIVPPPQATPKFAVFPLLSDQNPDYGVFIADRLVDELMQHRDVPALKGRWFELVEPDTIYTGRLRKILATQQSLQGDDLHLLRTASGADRAMIGEVTYAGTRSLHLRIIDLETGGIIWKGKARDDENWQWVYQDQKTGGIAIGNLMGQLGFKEIDRRGATLTPDELPLHVAFVPLHSSQKAIVGGYERLIRETMINNGLFGDLEIAPISGARINKAMQMAIVEAKGVDAILCGSLLGSGKDNAINAVSVALRLIAVPSGKIIWAGSANARRVWRKDKFDDLTQTIASELSTHYAQARAGVYDNMWADQPDPQDGPGWLSRGMTALERGLLMPAEEAFLQAENFEDSQVQALEGLARVYARRPTLRQRSIDYYKRVIEADTTRADLYYALASVYYDMEISQCLSLAEQAIAIDSTYSAPYRLIGDWLARDDWYARKQDIAVAASYYVQYLDLEPDDIDVATKLGKLLLQMEDYATIAKLILPFIEKYPSAIELLPVAAQWALQVAKTDASEMYWHQYLTHLGEQTMGLYVDPSLILPEKLGDAYAQLAQEEKEAFANRFWLQKDQDMTTEVNERLLEHYQRVWAARQYFGQSAYPWDQRGEVFIRYGKPDYRSRSGRTPEMMSAAVEQIKERLYAELYDVPSEGSLVGTVFPVRSSRSMMAYETFGVRGRSANTYIQGDGFLPVTAGIDHSLVSWESWVYVSVGNGMEITFTDEMGSGHFDFAPVPMRQVPGMRSIARVQQNAPELAFTRAVDETPDQHRPWWRTRELAFFYDIADARGDMPETRLDVAFGLPVSDNETRQGGITLAAALYDSTANHTLRMSRQVKQTEVPLETEALLTDLLTMNTTPGFYQLTVKAENPSTNRLSMYQQNVHVEPYGTAGLQMSDLIFAAQVEESDANSPFQRGKLKVVPLPTRAFLPQQDLGLYFEIYNLVPDPFGQMRYRITIQITTQEQDTGLRDVLTGPKPIPEISLTFDQVTSEKAVSVYQFIDLTDSKHGRNLLRVVVEDVVTGQRVEKEKVFRYGN